MATPITRNFQHFLQLPLEIRYSIYKQLLQSNDSISFDGISREFTFESENISTAILKSCHQTKAEATEFLYKNNVFNFPSHHLDLIANTITQQNFQTIRHVNISISNLWFRPDPINQPLTISTFLTKGLEKILQCRNMRSLTLTIPLKRYVHLDDFNELSESTFEEQMEFLECKDEKYLQPAAEWFANLHGGLTFHSTQNVACEIHGGLSSKTPDYFSADKLVKICWKGHKNWNAPNVTNLNIQHELEQYLIDLDL